MRNRLTGTILLTALLLSALQTGGSSSASQKSPEGRDVTSRGPVAIVPFLDREHDRLRALGVSETEAERKTRERLREAAEEELEKRLRQSGIPFVAQEQRDAALKAVGLVPDQEKTRTEEAFAALARQLQVRHVLTGIIEASRPEVQTAPVGERIATRRYRGLPYELVGQAQVQFRVFDAARERFDEALERTVKERDRGRLGLDRPARLQEIAVRDATRKAMARFLAAHRVGRGSVRKNGKGRTSD